MSILDSEEQKKSILSVFCVRGVFFTSKFITLDVLFYYLLIEHKNNNFNFGKILDIIFFLKRRYW